MPPSSGAARVVTVVVGEGRSPNDFGSHTSLPAPECGGKLADILGAEDAELHLFRTVCWQKLDGLAA